MNRQIYQKIGLIIALAIAGVSLPTAIVSLIKEPTIINNYNQTYYNQTYYEENYYDGDNETKPDYTKPLEVFTYTDLIYDEYFADLVFNMSAENTIFLFSNETNPSFSLFIVLDSMVSYFYAGYRCWIWETQVDDFKEWTPPCYNTYHMICQNDQGSGLESVEIFVEIG